MSVEQTTEKGQMVSVGSDAWLAVGASVTWCHSSSNGRSIGFSTRRGKIVQLNHENGMAFVKYRQTHLWVPIKRLRSASARTELTEMVMGEDSSANHRISDTTK